MAAYRNAVEVDIWTVSKLMDAVSSSPTSNSRVTIPEYQRRLVWSHATRKGLIESIKSGFPFGSILLYEDIGRGQAAGDGKRYYNLIDGLQRTQALQSYVRYQNGYFTRADVDDALVDDIARHLGKETEAHKDKIRNAIVRWVKNRNSYDAADGWSKDNLVDALIADVLGFRPDTGLFRDLYFDLNRSAELSATLGSFLDEVSSEVKLVLEAKIPVLVYSGPASELPVIFELLNSKGTSLSRYEIFAAKWIEARYKIENRAIIDAIWKKYDALEEEGFTLDVSEETPDEAARLEREYTLFDYLFGFGQYLADKFPLLFKPVKIDQPSSAGFNLITACLGLPIPRMGELPEAMGDMDLGLLEHRMLEAANFVNKLLKPVLALKQYGRVRAPIYHSELMIIAMIATAFQVRFSVHTLDENQQWRGDRRRLRRNLMMFYLHDILHDDWRGSGDSKLYESVKSLRYLYQSPPSAQRWAQVLDDWYVANQIEHVHGKSAKRHIRDSRPEYLLLKYIYAERLADAKTYHVEHIMPVKQLQSAMDANEEWPINTIGNLALLDKAGELRDNLVPYDSLLQDKVVRGLMTAEERDEQAALYAERLLCPEALLPNPLSKESFEDFLLDRFKLLKDEFVRVWREHIPED